MEQPVVIAWFRQDLRIHDNPALRAAAAQGRVLPIYILDDENAASWSMGGASRAWLHHSLQSLNRALDGKLQLFRGDARALLQRLSDEHRVTAIYWNRCYEPWRIERDSLIKQALGARGIDCHSFNASLLWEPWDVAKPDGDPYRVFTPFYQKGCHNAAEPRQPLPAPERLQLCDQACDTALKLDQLSLLPQEPPWHQPMLAHWRIGEDAAAERLQQFRVEGLAQYRRGRDFPGREWVSRLSPHLRFGEISPHQVWHPVSQQESGENAAHFLRELGWREFSYHLLYHFPDLPGANFNGRFDAFDWLDDPASLRRWQRGQTGFPIVDAGMRELWQTGYMHNRVRMVVASFLVKNLLIHWRRGAEWFWDCLFDADLANNSASWQWCAGSGADAAPYFRIFNPVLQSRKFDADGDYLLRYCPELAGLPAPLRHCPWEASAGQLDDAGLRLGVDYPEPMVDLKVTRERALARYKLLG